jgi:hypothetical protein
VSLRFPRLLGREATPFTVQKGVLGEAVAIRIENTGKEDYRRRVLASSAGTIYRLGGD